MLTPKELCEKEYYSRFVQGLWVVPNVSEEELTLAATGARQARFEFGKTPNFKRSRFNDDEEWIDISQECIDAINQGLSDIGLSLQPIGQVAGRTKYKVLPANRGAQEPIKNIIFAAKYKPDIVLDDALSNDIKVVNANGALIYDQGIPANGISWETLANWYELLDLDNTE